MPDKKPDANPDANADVQAGGRVESSSQYYEGPGEILRDARLALQVDLREVADALNLPIKMIDDLEANNFAELPPPVFARGYVRAYAKLLELDPGPLVENFPGIKPDLPPTQESSSHEAIEWLRANPLISAAVAGAIALILLISLIVWIWPDDEVEESAASTAAVQGNVAAAARPTGEAVVGFDAQPQDIVVSDSADGATLTTRRLTAEGNDRLSFHFNDECWVEVKSSAGVTLYSDVNETGQQVDLVGAGPFRVLLGYAPGVRMRFNNETVALAPHTRNNVATLMVGQ